MWMRVELARDESTWHFQSAIMLQVAIINRSARRTKELQHNNSFNPTRDSMAFMIFPCSESLMLFARAG
jgi:hypothetical protein